MNISLFILVICAISYTYASDCSRKWLSGYRLASGRPQKILNSVSFSLCEDECVNTLGCGAFAYGTSQGTNGTCELAISLRTSRSINNSLELSDVDKAPPYDVYTLDSNQNCFKRSPLFSTKPSSVQSPIPIDCFYRLMSGRRLSKTHALKSISVNNLQECQEGCISERSFACRSISYRYMPSGYSYSVSNCELSPFYMMSERSTSHDFIEDFDYDFFQREPYCKSSASGNVNAGSNYGVCAVVVRRGGKLSSSLVKSAHSVSTNAQCEHLCTTALFRCRAFAFRHTERGRDRDVFRSQDDCQLYETDLARLPSYNIETDPDFDLFEMGRLMAGTCMLQGQFNNNNKNFNYDKYNPVTSPYPPIIMKPQDRQDYFPNYPSSHNYPNSYPNYHNNYPSRYPSSNYPSSNYPSSNYPSSNYPKYPSVGSQYPPPYESTSAHPLGSKYDDFPQPGLSPTSRPSDIKEHNLLRPPVHTQMENIHKITPFYDQRSEVCLVKYRGDAFLAPEVSRATFPVKTLEECRVECLRSEQVLRFNCNFMAFRLTSGSGGTCQLSDSRELMNSDLIPGSGTIFSYEITDSYCARKITTTDRRYDSNNHASYADPKYEYNSNNRRYDTGYYGTASGARDHYGGNYAGANYGSSGYYDRGSYPNNYDRYGSYNDRYNKGQYYPTSSSSSIGNYYGGNYGSSYGSASYAPQPIETGGMTTVDGERCLHSCVRNKDAGFYYCQIDTEGSWNFCCRPDEGGQCGYSKGLSFSWCYVGTGPSRNIWRTCNKRSPLSSTHAPYPPHHSVSYLHDRQPPTVHTLASVNEIANLTKDAALELLENNDNKSDKLSVDFVLANNETSTGNDTTKSKREPRAF